MSAIITDIMVEKGPVLSDQLASVATNSKLGLKNSSSNGSSNASSPFLIGVAGGTASGKSTVCRKIMEKLGQDTVERHHQRVVCISQDSFYRELDENERQDALRGNYNFDHPDALDNDFMLQVLQDILNSREVQLPIYDFTSMRCVFTACGSNDVTVSIIHTGKQRNSKQSIQRMSVCISAYLVFPY